MNCSIQYVLIPAANCAKNKQHRNDENSQLQAAFRLLFRITVSTTMRYAVHFQTTLPSTQLIYCLRLQLETVPDFPDI